MNTVTVGANPSQIEGKLLAPGIVSYSNVMRDPAGLIRDLDGLTEMRQLIWQPGQQGSGIQNRAGALTRSIRDVETVSIPAFAKTPELKATGGVLAVLSDLLDASLLPLLDAYSRQFGIGGDLDNEGWQLLKYGTGQHFDRHADAAKMFQRRVSMSFYLNSDFEGGEIEFDQFNLKIKPETNQVVFFPSTYVYTHKVWPVISGLRYCVVGWFH